VAILSGAKQMHATLMKLAVSELRRDAGRRRRRVGLAPWVGLALALAAHPAAAVAADGAPSPAAGPPRRNDVPVLLMLQTATSTQAIAREERFTDELSMLLDGVSVQVERPADTGFPERGLGNQIAQVRTMIDRHGAVAATWLTEATPDLLLLHLVVVSTGRALVRLVETRPQPGFETDLALATRELLGTAFLFDRPPGPAGGDPIAGVVESVRARAAPAPDPATTTAAPALPPRPPEWAIAVELRFEGGLVGASGPRLYPGGALALERRMVSGLRGRLSFSALGGPLGERRHDERIREWAVQPGLALGYRFELGATSLGPWLELQAFLSNVSIEVDEGTDQEFRSWRLRGAATLDFRAALGPRIDLLAAAGLTATPQQDVYRRLSTDRVALASAFLSWEARLGLVFYLGPSRP